MDFEWNPKTAKLKRISKNIGPYNSKRLDRDSPRKDASADVIAAIRNVFSFFAVTFFIFVNCIIASRQRSYSPLCAKIVKKRGEAIITKLLDKP